MIKWLRDINSSDFHMVGGKAYKLAEMYKKNINIPNAFVITSDIYNKYVKDNRLEEKIQVVLKSEIDVREKSNTIQPLFTVDKLSEEFTIKIVSAFKKLKSDSVAVRSSSTAEDLADMSFAGQYSSFLNVSEENLIEKIILCWQSLWNTEAIEYRSKNVVSENFSHCIIVQEMINSEVSGVIFTANPMTGNRNEIIINASYGLGEAIVSGKVNPDEYFIDKDKKELIKENISSKEYMCKYCESGTEYLTVDSNKAIQKSLKSIHLNEITQQAIYIEKLFGSPQDIEFGYYDNKLYILQSRNITTLFPINNLDKDGKLRAYLAASSVMLGMKEPFTPLGADLYGGMYPAMINVMTGRKQPLSDDFVKYEACRIFVDITYLLSSKFISKQLGNAFSGSDLPLKDTVNMVIDKYGDIFTHQGIKFKFPFGVIKYGVGALKKYSAANKFDSVEKNEKIREMGRAFYDDILEQSKTLNTPEQRWNFCTDMMMQVFKLTQNQAWFCTEVNNFAKIEKYINRNFPNRYNLDVLSYSFPECITVEFNIVLNKLAKYYDENNIVPSVKDKKMIEFLDKYGHRATVELDFGYRRWREDAQYLIEQINTYIADKSYKKNLADIDEKLKRANDMIEDLYSDILERKGKKEADKIKSLIIEFRRASGMREYPKYNIVQGLEVARMVMLAQGNIYCNKGLLDHPDDIFFLHKEEILSGNISKSIVKANRENYEKEMKRNSIPRIVLNTGEVFYSAQKFDKNSKTIKGIPLSSGTYEGKIKIVKDPLNANLDEGEIMMAESTNPAWTPLFMIAGGLILEYGGPLSHGGIVAREMGIPAVVGVSIGSGMLNNGQKVRIYGDTGVVEII